MDEQERVALIQRAVDGDVDALQCLIVHYHGVLLMGTMCVLRHRFVNRFRMVVPDWI